MKYRLVSYKFPTAKVGEDDTRLLVMAVPNFFESLIGRRICEIEFEGCGTIWWDVGAGYKRASTGVSKVLFDMETWAIKQHRPFGLGVGYRPS